MNHAFHFSSACLSPLLLSSFINSGNILGESRRFNNAWNFRIFFGNFLTGRNISENIYLIDGRFFYLFDRLGIRSYPFSFGNIRRNLFETFFSLLILMQTPHPILGMRAYLFFQRRHFFLRLAVTKERSNYCCFLLCALNYSHLFCILGRRQNIVDLLVVFALGKPNSRQ